jgi:hypothetical protein
MIAGDEDKLKLGQLLLSSPANRFHYLLALAGICSAVFVQTKGVFGQPIIGDCKTHYNSPSPSGRELEGGGFHPHLTPLPSRERIFI